MGMGKAKGGSATVFPGWLNETENGGVTATEKELRSKRTRGSKTESNRE